MREARWPTESFSKKSHRAYMMTVDDTTDERDKGGQLEHGNGLQESAAERLAEAACTDQYTEVELTDKQKEIELLEMQQARATTRLAEKCEVLENNRASFPSEKETGKLSRRGFIRHMVAVLALSSIVLANMNRQAFNQALVSMTKTRSIPTTPTYDEPIEGPVAPLATGGLWDDQPANTVADQSPTIHDEEQPPQQLKTESTETVDTPTEHEEEEDKFDWTASQIGTLQAAFSYGYTPFMIPGGRMSELYGAKWVVFVSGFGSALCCILSPFLADTDYRLLVASRVVMGLSQTGVSPALYALLARWLPPGEASVYLPMIKVGVMIGFMSGSLVSGFFTWRLTFYIVGMISMLWCIMWVFLISSDPSEHNLIQSAELKHIQFEIRKVNKGRAQTRSEARKSSAPWMKILTNPVILAYMFAKFTVKLSVDTQTMQLPMYLKDVFHVSKELNGILTSLNFAIQAIFTGFVAWLAKEFVVNSTFGLSKTGVRRIFQGACNFGMAFAYLLITLHLSLGVVCTAVVLLAIASMFGAGGEAILPMDLSLEYSASIMAIANSAANMSGVVLPSMVAIILGDQLGSSERWNLVWWSIGAIVASGGVVFACKVNAEVQDFSDKGKETKKDGGREDEPNQIGAGDAASKFIVIEMQKKKENKLSDKLQSVRL